MASNAAKFERKAERGIRELQNSRRKRRRKSEGEEKTRVFLFLKISG